MPRSTKHHSSLHCNNLPLHCSGTTHSTTPHTTLQCDTSCHRSSHDTTVRHLTPPKLTRHYVLTLHYSNLTIPCHNLRPRHLQPHPHTRTQQQPQQVAIIRSRAHSSSRSGNQSHVKALLRGQSRPQDRPNSLLGLSLGLMPSPLTLRGLLRHSPCPQASQPSPPAPTPPPSPRAQPAQTSPPSQPSQAPTSPHSQGRPASSC